jgi:hypothetical protein
VYLSGEGDPGRHRQKSGKQHERKNEENILPERQRRINDDIQLPERIAKQLRNLNIQGIKMRQQTELTYKSVFIHRH